MAEEIRDLIEKLTKRESGGEGIITAGSVEHPVKPLHLSSVKKDENRGICCIQQMALLGIREDV